VIRYLTVHFGSARWIDIQRRNIERHTHSPHEVWASLDEVEPGYEDRFDVAMSLEGGHGEKLNEMARRACEVSAPDDVLIFIDGDAFPIEDVTAMLERRLPEFPLIAARRLENLGDPQPHPCFAVTTAGFWRSIDGDWSKGGRGWRNRIGRNRKDVGGRILNALEDKKIAWLPLDRSNRRNVHPVLFGVYGDLVYHHGAAFRATYTSYDIWRAERLISFLRIPGAKTRQGLGGALIAKRRDRRIARNQRDSERIYAEIERDDDYIERFFLKRQADEQRVILRRDST